MARVLVWLVRLVEARAFGLSLALVGLLLAFFKDVAGVPKTFAWWVAASGVFITAVQFMRESGLSFFLGRLLRPKYRGLDPYLSKIDDDKFLRGFLTPSPGIIDVDALQVVKEAGDVVERMRLCGADEGLHHNAALMNATAFRGSRYQAAADRKFVRNMSISRQHPAAIAIIGSHAGQDRYDALSGILPLDRSSVTSYQTGHLADNDVNGPHIASVDTQSDMLLAFMIANEPVAQGKALGRRTSLPHFGDLLKCGVLQVILIAALANRQRDVFLVAANSQPSLQRLFDRLNFVRRNDFRSADGATMFGTNLRLANLTRAARLIARRNPQVASVFPQLLGR